MDAVILLSGGLDSAVILAMALQRGLKCHAITFDYNQRHYPELESARKLVTYYGISHSIFKISPDTFKTSALVDDITVPKNRTAEEIQKSIPVTYVPARNTLFLSYAMGQAEILNATEIHYGANALDSHPYPDCRPEFIQAFQNLLNVATKQAVLGHPPQLMTPLLYKTKKEIFKLAEELKVPVELTWSCYAPEDNTTPCGVCDACVLRKVH
jgi:7-cyano-7-deazaguanine synthase